MTDDEIMAHWKLAEGTTDMRADLVSFARTIIAQARAEWEAELKVVAWADAAAIKLLSKGFHAVVFPEPRDTHLKPLAIIPATKEGHE